MDGELCTIDRNCDQERLPHETKVDSDYPVFIVVLCFGVGERWRAKKWTELL